MTEEYKRLPNTQYVLSLSYGKDSIACLEAIKLLGLPLDRIVHAEVWATEDIHADLPPMVAFKEKADRIILDRYGIRVEHICATKQVERERERRSPTSQCSTECLPRENILVQSRDFHSSGAVGANTSKRGTRLTYQDIFYRPTKKVWDNKASITGFATRWSQFCTSELKNAPIKTFPRAPCRKARE